MFNWAKQQLANVAGTQEPIYGPEAIQPVTQQAEKVPYTELKKDDLRWFALDSTSVETQTFYFMSDSGHMAMNQIIYSNVAGLMITCQFNCKIFYPNASKPPLWASDALSNHGFDEEKFSFHADNCSVELSADDSSYTIKSATNAKSIVDVKVTRAAPGFVVGKNGTSYFGTDPKAPWGSMRHAFWPRCRVEGHILTPGEDIDFKGGGFFVAALQGMKPHHAGMVLFYPNPHAPAHNLCAAARWKFVSFQSPSYSAVMMEYTTPPSYGSTVVNVGGIAVDNAILCAGAPNTAEHVDVEVDPENEWPEPTAVSYRWQGKTHDGKDVSADLGGSLGKRLDRIDIMVEVPKFVKQIVAGAAGTKPYIYQYGPELTLKLRIGDEVKEEKGRILAEATFIS